MSQEKIFVGNGKQKDFDWGSVVSMNLDLDDLIKQFGEHGFYDGNGKRKIRVTLAKKREPGQYGDTHYLTLDTWHPDGYQKPGPIPIGTAPAAPAREIRDEDDIPF